jgi:glycine/serine hydroxymethyltransferase
MENTAAATAFKAGLEVISAVEPAIAAAIAGELGNQRRQLKLIASENYASPAVLLAMGNWLSDKYAEGTVGSRFYAGCEFVDKVEQIAAGHATALFGAEHAYVQPHSGIDANLVAFWSILAKRVEEPALAQVGAKSVNDMTEEDWAWLRAGLLRDRPADRPDRLRRARRPGQGVQAADPGRRLLRLPADAEFPDHARDRGLGRCDAHGGHGALRGPGGRRGADRRGEPGPIRPRGDLHYAQVAARAARRVRAVHQ